VNPPTTGLETHFTGDFFVAAQQLFFFQKPQTLFLKGF
jgi:hypothetical protein